MPRTATLAAVLAGFTLAACGGAAEPETSTSQEALGRRVGAFHAPVCPGPAAADDARCHARVVTDDKGAPQASTAPNGLGPSQLQTAYALLPKTFLPGETPTIAIVDAFDDPEAESDLNVYRSTYGLRSCTTSNGCFRKVNQKGAASPLPRADQGWALEISLDLQAASAICPECNILLVEAKTNSFANLMAAVDMAVKLGATVISNSYGAGEFSGETTYDWHFDHPGVPITVSSGDAGYGVEYPAASRFVTAVGGTTLRLDGSGNRLSETAWSGAGSGCSAYEPKPSAGGGPSWQTDVACSRRTVADVSAVADPNTGLSVYDTHGYQGQQGWFVVGGTSASAPIIAAVYALAGNAASTTYGSYPYSNTSSLFDVTSGWNGSCGGSYLCTAVPDFDGPTGFGTPIGTGAF
jgi:subtilase family serine protease